MTIDKEQLVELLVEKTSMDTEEIKAQLNQLIERILDASKRGKALEIKEFGSFYFDKEGELRFDSAEELSTEISFKYAGMKPVELKPERDTAIPDIEKNVEDEFDDLPELDEDEDELPEDSFDELDIDEEEADVDLSNEPGIEEDLPFDIDDEDNEVEDESVIEGSISSEGPEVPEEPAEKEETKVADFKPISRQHIRKRDNTGIYVLIGILLIAVLIGIYFYYVSRQSPTSVQPEQSTFPEMQFGMNGTEDAATNGSTGSQVNDSQEDEAEPNLEMIANDQTSTEQAEPNQSTEEGVVAENGNSFSETDEALYGLMGSIIEEANSGYSIVIHSFRDENRAMAMETADQLRADGYRAMATSRTVSENLVWRVSVGQFETRSDAEQARTRLPEPYNTQNFIQRIRIN